MNKLFVTVASITSLLFVTPPAFGQQTTQHNDTAPLYRVTVVERTAKALNYQYRSGPTQIDFRGTVLLPHAKGEATVESRQGSTEIQATVHGLASPRRFGGEYLTYVLWAVTPEGRPHNIGELIPDSSDKAKVRATTDLQAFALIVTAEPYSAVRQPSDVVVAENEVRPDTIGTVEPVQAKYELLPRGEYTWHVPGDLDAAAHESQKVSMHEYEAISELYQAQNALGIAANAEAARFAPDTFARAQQLLVKAQQLHGHKGDFRQVIQSAREAAQTAEDSRMIAQRSQQKEQLQAADVELSRARAELSAAQQAKERAQDQAQQAQAQADAARIQAETALAAETRSDSERPAERQRTARVQSPALASITPVGPAPDLTGGQHDLRQRLLQDMKGVLPTLDTPRGLVSTLPDDGFHGAALRDSFSAEVARIAAVLSRHSGLRVSVEGHSDSPAKAAESEERAQAVRRILIANGVAAGAVFTAGRADSRPLASNATAQGRKQNSRVEIVITGEPIGKLPLWDHPYSLTGSARQPSRIGQPGSVQP